MMSRTQESTGPMTTGSCEGHTEFQVGGVSQVQRFRAVLPWCQEMSPSWDRDVFTSHKAPLSCGLHNFVEVSLIESLTVALGGGNGRVCEASGP